MCFGGSVPAAPVVTPTPVVPAVIAPISADQSSQVAGDEARRRARAAGGRSSTNITGGLGDTSTAQTGQKRLLGG
jgi:hypothetical protein